MGYGRWLSSQIAAGQFDPAAAPSARIRSEDSREEAMPAIRRLIDRIEVRAGAKRGAAEVTLVVAFARILALGTNKNAAPEGGGTNLLVAGGRIDLDRTSEESLKSQKHISQRL